MKKIFSNLLLSSSLFSNIYAFNDICDSHQSNYTQLSYNENSNYNREKNEWERAKVIFDMDKFIKNYNKAARDNNITAIPTNQLTDENKAKDIFSVLIELKNYYKEKNDSNNYAYTYLSYAKLLSLGFYPKERQLRQSTNDSRNNRTLDYCKKQFINSIREKIACIANDTADNSKVVKWELIYDGHLYLSYVKQFSNTSYKEEYLKNAYYKFEKASFLKTTKTSYLLMAEVILDFGYTPQGYSRDEAIDLAWEYIKKAHEKKTGGSGVASNLLEKREKSLVEETAQPTYINKLNNSIEQSPIPGLNRHSNIGSPLSPLGGDDFNDPMDDSADHALFNQRDLLENFDFSALSIPTHQNATILSASTSFLNPIDGPQEVYVLDGKLFHRQNVSGEDFSCFFNSTGLTRREQYNLMLQNCDNPILRHMIASELLMLSENPEEIDPNVKEAMKYDLYKLQKDSLDLQTEQALRPETEIEEKRDEIRRELYKRCVTLETFMTYMEHHIGGDKMMVTYPSREDGELSGDYTAIDAMGLLNNLGLKIYGKENNRLKLIHSYIPDTATQISYIYHEGIHFQALVPSVEAGLLSIQNGDYQLADGFREAFSAQMSLSVWPFTSKACIRLIEPKLLTKNCKNIDIIEKHDGAWIASSNVIKALDNQTTAPATNNATEASKTQASFFSEDQKLKELYPSVVSAIMSGSGKYRSTKQYDADFVRKILYITDNTDKSYVKIGAMKDISLDSRRISEILLANGRRSFAYMENHNKEMIAQAYLEAYPDVQDGKLTQRDVHITLANHLNVTKEKLVKQMHFFVNGGYAKTLDITDKKLISKVCNSYKHGESVYEISKKLSISIHSISKLLHENLPNLIKYTLNLPYTKKLGEEESKNLIIKTYKSLEKPSVFAVFKALKAKGIGHKTVDRILKAEGVVSKEIKAKHLAPKKIQEIKDLHEDLISKNFSKEEIYETLAEKTGATTVQVIDIIKNRTYNTESEKEIRKRAEKVRKAYEALTDEQKLTPVRFIKKTLEYADTSIKTHLEKQGLYKADSGRGSSVTNILAPTYNGDSSNILKRAEKKRKYISSPDQNKKVKK